MTTAMRVQTCTNVYDDENDMRIEDSCGRKVDNVQTQLSQVQKELQQLRQQIEELTTAVKQITQPPEAGDN